MAQIHFCPDHHPNEKERLKKVTELGLEPRTHALKGRCSTS